MDTELKGKTTARRLDTDEDVEDNDLGDNKEVAEGAHVLTNLLESLEASAGTPGPVPNMLKQMGAANPTE
jgi:hypothetical protein